MPVLTAFGAASVRAADKTINVGILHSLSGTMAIDEINASGGVLVFYPVQYEGEELSKNVFYIGAAPNQQAIPA